MQKKSYYDEIMQITELGCVSWHSFEQSFMNILQIYIHYVNIYVCNYTMVSIIHQDVKGIVHCMNRVTHLYPESTTLITEIEPTGDQQIILKNL